MQADNAILLPFQKKNATKIKSLMLNNLLNKKYGLSPLQRSPNIQLSTDSKSKK